MANKNMPNIDVRGMLSRVNFPATKQEVINFAKSKGAPQELVSALNGIPDREYMDIDDLMKEVDSKMSQ